MVERKLDLPRQTPYTILMTEPATKLPVSEHRAEPGLPESDPFRLGWRMRYRRLPDGRLEEKEVPLTPEELLDPEIGDHMVQNFWHGILGSLLFVLLRRHFKPRKDVLVGFDVKILWGVPGLQDPAPDISIIPGVRDRDKKERTLQGFNVHEEGTRPCLVIEVVSPNRPEYYHADHVRKPKIYRRAGVPEYLIIDLPPEGSGPPLKLSGYRLDAKGRYRRIKPDAKGRLFSETTGLWFGITRDGENVFFVDAATGKRRRTDV